ncbi:MAG: gluconate 2-dehydrogenase subunit 3 family protein [Myxococcota bacterium]|nr:gluconate 2-dehydrogenase subunit 3 family protein [Myxococcota bacterium]
MHRIRRRLFLALAFLSPLVGSTRSLAWLLRASVGAPATRPLGALPRYVDTLLPRHLGPSGTDLRVERSLLESAQADPRYARLLVGGCSWLDEQARALGKSGFHELDEEARTGIVARAEAAKPGSGEWTFYQKTRTDAFTFYYSDPRSLAGIEAPGPPQPSGHLDQAEPPRERARGASLG